MSHIPEDRHKHGLVLDFTLEQNLVLQRYKEPEFEKGGFIKKDAVRAYAERLIEEYDIRSGQGPVTTARSMSGGNQQKAIIAREVDRNKPLIVAVQPTRGLDVGAIENVHKELVKQRDAGKDQPDALPHTGSGDLLLRQAHNNDHDAAQQQAGQDGQQRGQDLLGAILGIQICQFLFHAVSPSFLSARLAPAI